MEGSQCLPSELCLAGENGRESDSGEVKRHRQAAVMAPGMATVMPSATATEMARLMATGNGRGQQMAGTAATAATASKQSDGVNDGVSDSGRRWWQATGGSDVGG